MFGIFYRSFLPILVLCVVSQQLLQRLSFHAPLVLSALFQAA